MSDNTMVMVLIKVDTFNFNLLAIRDLLKTKGFICTAVYKDTGVLEGRCFSSVLSTLYNTKGVKSISENNSGVNCLIQPIELQMQTIKEKLEQYKDIIEQQNHLDKGSIEQIYWHYGYYIALRDVLGQISTDRAKSWEL